MKKPLIGIVARPTKKEEESKLFVNEDYRKAVILAGGIPFLILPLQNIYYNQTRFSENENLTDIEKKDLMQVLELCDGIIMPGGNKIFQHDFFILEEAIKRDIPILGICLGMQIMANYQREILNEANPNSNHNQENVKYAHKVTIDKKSKLHQIIKKDQIEVNSYHNFHVLPNSIYQTVGMSEDNLIEALELPEKSFHIGIQWHPEKMYSYDENARVLFQSFIKACCDYSKNKKKNGF